MAQPSSSPPPLGGPASLTNYLKAAFLHRWNLLAFLGGLGAAALSPWPDGVIPLVIAAETAYLGGLVAFPRFRKAVDAQVHQRERRPQAAESQLALERVLAGLSLDSRTRFDKLRRRCLEMRDIADGVRGRKLAGDNAASDLSAGALDRLLWVFLRLLASQEALRRFLASTDEDAIRAQLEQAQAKLAGGANERLQRSLEDSVSVHQARLDNYAKAESNAEFVKVELDRIEAKIHALTESSVSRQDAEALSSQIDSVAQSMESTEVAISELQQITGMVDELQEPPPILSAYGNLETQ